MHKKTIMIFHKSIRYIDPSSIYRQLPNKAWHFWLDSADTDSQQLNTNRYSYIGLDPFCTFTAEHDHVVIDGKQHATNDAIQCIADLLAEHPLTANPKLPPFQGGAIGYLSYDLCHTLEGIPLPSHDLCKLPLMAFAFYDVLLSFDHHQKKAWIVANGLPEKTASKKQQRAKQRIMEIHTWLAMPQHDVDTPQPASAPKSSLQSNFTASAYIDMVNRTKDHIRAGDIFEANVTQQFHQKIGDDVDAYTLYTYLRKTNPAPFAAYLAFDDCAIASASPERFLSVHQGAIETRPIKGTQPRHHDPAIDQANAKILLASQKDHAENTMIVDLMRNDLSRICLPHSIQVPQLCVLESFASVHHLVSVITGKLQANTSLTDIIKATFPGGSITGAPKIRAMQIISALEQTRRGPYCGSIGYLGYDGSMDLSITIRSFIIRAKTLSFNVGGAVTLQSNPAQEHQESLDKARALNDAVACYLTQDITP